MWILRHSWDDNVVVKWLQSCWFWSKLCEDNCWKVTFGSWDFQKEAASPNSQSCTKESRKTTNNSPQQKRQTESSFISVIGIMLSLCFGTQEVYLTLVIISIVTIIGNQICVNFVQMFVNFVEIWQIFTAYFLKRSPGQPSPSHCGLSRSGTCTSSAVSPAAIIKYLTCRNYKISH